MSVVFVDTFSGGVGTMRGKSDPMKVLRVLKSDPNNYAMDPVKVLAWIRDQNAKAREDGK